MIRTEKRSVRSLVAGMRVKTGARYGLFEFSGYILLSSADCGRYGEVQF